MKLTSVLAGSAIAALALFSDIGAGIGLPQMAQAQAAVSVSFNLFYDRLANDGDWVRYRDDYVFIPANVQRGWKPYTVGHWVYADRVGWTWASDESFGWATYHYGRWGYADDIGWYWVPGTRWAPAWVSWKKTSDYVVWAPLPPRGRSNDVSVTVSVGDVPDFYWVAVPTKRFLEPNLRVVIVDNDVERRRIVQRADVIGTVKVQNNIVVNTVINVDVIERESGRKVKRVAVRDTKDPAEARASADQVTVFEGEVKAEADAKPKRVRDVKEARKIRREDAGQDNAGTQTDQNADQNTDATGSTTRQNGSNADTGTEDTQQTGNGNNKARKERNTQTGEPAASQDNTTAGEDQSTTGTGKTKAEKRKNKAAGQPDQPTSKNKGNGAEVTLPEDNQNGNGADVTVPDQAQSGKAKADANRQKAQQKKKAAPDESATQSKKQKAQSKQKAAPEDQSQSESGGQKVKRSEQQQPEQGGTQKQQRKKGKAQNCDPADPSCAQ
jgi:hypothetical protein